MRNRNQTPEIFLFNFNYLSTLYWWQRNCGDLEISEKKSETIDIYRTAKVSQRRSSQNSDSQQQIQDP